jgi:hypothetical protein
MPLDSNPTLQWLVIIAAGLVWGFACRGYFAP